MLKRAHFLQDTPVFNGRTKPYPGWVAGYAAIIEALKLPMPMVLPIAMVSEKKKRFYSENWLVVPGIHLPEDNMSITRIQALYNHLVFALKHEGVNLLVFAKLAEKLSQEELLELLDIEPTGQYTRRIWFLIEWITDKVIQDKPDLTKKSYVPLLDAELQYTVSGIKSPRHLIINNLPGNPNFCPLIRKTAKLESHLQKEYREMSRANIAGIGKEIIARASAFMMLNDSKASFSIEGESPKSKRAARWGVAIGQAGVNDLSKEELVRLQELVIENTRFVHIGYRNKGGFVGEHDRITGEPMPAHISARHEDIEDLMKGLIEANHLLINDHFDAVLAAALISFGFVFIHPFEDGNGRIHRYLIHHVLAKKHFSDEGVVFPVSSSILAHIDNYRFVLEYYSQPLLDWIEWKETSDHNISVTNETKDFYRFFDATRQAEFLYDCVKDTLEHIIPQEIDYLAKFDTFKQHIEDEFAMPDKMISMLVRFLSQNNGKLSNRAREKEFTALTSEEIANIELLFSDVFGA